MTQGEKEINTFNSAGDESKVGTIDMKGREREKMSIKRSYSIEVNKKSPLFFLHVTNSK